MILHQEILTGMTTWKVDLQVLQLELLEHLSYFRESY
jgi:hypothetical protein